MTDSLFASPLEASAKDSGAWWQGSSTSQKAWWDTSPATVESGFDYESGRQLAIDEYAKAAARLQSVGIDPDTVDAREKEPLWARGIKTLTGLGVGLDWLFGDALLRMVIGGATGLLKGEGLDWAVMQGDEVDKYAEQEDYDNLLGTQQVLGILPADWHPPTGKELLLMWGMDQSSDRKGKIDLIDGLGLLIEVGLSPATWFGQGWAPATDAAVRGGSKALRVTSSKILGTLADDIAGVMMRYGDDAAEVIARNFGHEANEIKALLARVTAPVSLTESGSADLISLLDHVAAIERMDSMGLLANLVGDTSLMRHELDVAKAALLPNVNELVKMGGGFAEAAERTDVKRLLTQLEEMTSHSYAANDAFKELTLRAAEGMGDLGGLKVGLPGWQFSKTGKGSVTLISQRQVDDFLTKHHISPTFIEHWKRSSLGRAFTRTFVSDWRLKELRNYDEGLANSLISLKRIAQAKADNELHQGINGLIGALQQVSGKKGRIDLMRLIEAPGDIYAEMLRVLDDSGVTAFRNLLKEGSPDPATLETLVAAHPGLADLDSTISGLFPPEVSAAIKRASEGAMNSDGARAAVNVADAHDKMVDLMASYRRGMLAEKLHAEGRLPEPKVPAKLITDETGRKVSNPLRRMFDAELAKTDAMSEELIEYFLASAKAKDLSDFNEFMGKFLDGHAEFSMYRATGYSFQGLTQENAREAAKRLYGLVRASKEMPAHSRAELMEALISEIAFLQMHYDETLAATEAAFRTTFGIGPGENIDDIIRGLRVGDYESLAAGKALTAVEGEAAKDAAVATQDAVEYARMAVSMQGVSGELQRLRKRIDQDVFELWSLMDAPVEDKAVAQAVLKEKLFHYSEALKANIPQGARPLIVDDEGVHLVGPAMRMTDIDRLATPETLAFYLSRNTAFDDAEILYGPEIAERLRREVDDNPTLLLDVEHDIAYRGKSQISDTYFYVTDDARRLHDVGLVTGTTDDLGIPAVRLVRDPVGIDEHAVRVAVDVRKVAVVDYDDFSRLTGKKDDIIRIVNPKGSKQEMTVEELISNGYDAVFVKSHVPAWQDVAGRVQTGRRQSHQLFVLTDQESYLQATRTAVDVAPDDPSAISRRPLIVSWTDSDGSVATHALAGEDAARIRAMELSGSTDVESQVRSMLNVPDGVEVTIDDMTGYVPGVRILEFDPERPLSYGAGIEVLRKQLDVDPDFLMREAYDDVGDIPDESLQAWVSRGQLTGVRPLAEMKGLWGSDAWWDVHDRALAAGDGYFDEVIDLKDIDPTIIDAMSLKQPNAFITEAEYNETVRMMRNKHMKTVRRALGMPEDADPIGVFDDAVKVREALESAKVHVMSAGAWRAATNRIDVDTYYGFYITRRKGDLTIYINPHAFTTYDTKLANASAMIGDAETRSDAATSLGTIIHELTHGIWEKVGHLDMPVPADRYYDLPWETAARNASIAYDDAIREIKGYPKWGEVRFTDMTIDSGGGADNFYRAFTDAYGTGWHTRDDIRKMHIFYDDNSGLGIGVYEAEKHVPPQMTTTETTWKASGSLRDEASKRSSYPRFPKGDDTAYDLGTATLTINKGHDGTWSFDIGDSAEDIVGKIDDALGVTPELSYPSREAAIEGLNRYIDEVREAITSRHLSDAEVEAIGIDKALRERYFLKDLEPGKWVDKTITHPKPVSPGQKGRYVLTAPVNESGIEGAAVHALIQATNPYVRMGAEVAINLPPGARDLTPFLEALGFELSETTDEMMTYVLNPAKWDDFLSRNPKALTRGIIEDLVDGEGIDYIRYSLPLPEPGSPGAERALKSLQTTVQLELRLRDRDRLMLEAIESARFDNLPKTFGPDAGLPEWSTLPQKVQDAAQGFFRGSDMTETMRTLTLEEADIARQWSDAVRVISDELEYGPEAMSTASRFGFQEVDDMMTGMAADVEYAKGVDVLSEAFLKNDTRFKKMERMAYQFLPKDIPDDKRRVMATLTAYANHYLREAQARGIAAEDLDEWFHAARVSGQVTVGEHTFTLGPGIAQEAVDKLNRKFGEPGAWVSMAKRYGLSVDVGDPKSLAAFSKKLYDTSVYIYQNWEQFEGLKGAMRVTALQTEIGRQLDIPESLWHRISPEEFMLPAYHYMPHNVADTSDIPWFRKMLGAYESTTADEVSPQMFARPVSTKMENFQMQRELQGTVESINRLVGHQMFHDDPAKAMSLYIQRAVRAITNYDMIESLLITRDSFGKRVIAPAIYDEALREWTAPKGYKVFTMRDIEKVGGDIDRLKELFWEQSEHIELLWKEHGRIKLMAREEIVEEFERASRHFFGDEQFNENMRLFNDVQSIWKTYATVVRPGFHMRNALSNVWQNLYAGVKNPRHYADAMELQIAAKKTEAFMLEAVLGDAEHAPRVITDINYAYQELVAAGKLKARSMNIGDRTYSYGELMALMKEHGILGTGRIGSDIHVFTDQQLKRLAPAQRYANPLSQAFFPTTVGRTFGETVENNARAAHFLAMMEATGGDPAAAAWSVRKYLFDYNELTDQERNVFRAVWPFYAWLRKNAELQANMLVHRPLQITAAVRIQNRLTRIDDTEYKPEWVEELGGFALPGLTVGGLNRLINGATGSVLNLDETAEQPLYVAIGLPYLDLLNYNGRDLLAAMSPLIRAPVEVISNHNIFFDTPIESWEGQLVKAPNEFVGLDDMVMSYGSEPTKAAWNELLAKWGVYRNELTGNVMTGAWFKYIWTQAQPHLGAYGKAIPSDDPDWMLDAINFWTGVKFIAVDEATSGYYAEKERLSVTEDVIRATEQRGTDVPTWTELKDEAAGGDEWWR